MIYILLCAITVQLELRVHTVTAHSLSHTHRGREPSRTLDLFWFCA